MWDRCVASRATIRAVSKESTTKRLKHNWKPIYWYIYIYIYIWEAEQWHLQDWSVSSLCSRVPFWVQVNSVDVHWDSVIGYVSQPIIFWIILYSLYTSGKFMHCGPDRATRVYTSDRLPSSRNNICSATRLIRFSFEIFSWKFAILKCAFSRFRSGQWWTIGSSSTKTKPVKLMHQLNGRNAYCWVPWRLNYTACLAFGA